MSEAPRRRLGELGRAVARAGDCVVSGLAAGIDAAAMGAAIRAGGRAVGVPSDHLDRRIRDPNVRAALAEGRLAMLTPYSPSAPFSVRTAMGRNKVVYGLADAAIVVATASGEGGTWTGAVETLERGAPRLFVRRIPADPGSHRLFELGASSLPFEAVPEAVGATDLLGRGQPASREEQVTIFGEVEPLRTPRTRRRKRAGDAPAGHPEAVVAETRKEPGRATAAETGGGRAPAEPPDNDEETGRERAGEVARALAVGAVGSVPVVGPVLGALVGVAWPDIKARRLERFAAELNRAVAAVGDRLDRDYVTRDGPRSSLVRGIPRILGISPSSTSASLPIGAGAGCAPSVGRRARLPRRSFPVVVTARFDARWARSLRRWASWPRRLRSS